MRINLVGAFIRNHPFGTEVAFKKGFDRLGEHLVNTIDTSYPGQVWDYNADVTVVFKWMENYWHDLMMCKGKKVVYQPDDLRFPQIQHMMSEMRRYCDYALTFDREGADIAEYVYGYHKAQRLLVTADDDLYRPLPEVEKDIDVCFVGSMTGGSCHSSREKMCRLVGALPGLKTMFVSGQGDPEEIVKIYNRSKVVLNHATDVGQLFGRGFGYQCRHFEVGFTRSCLLTNTTDEDMIRNVSFFANEADLVEQVCFLLTRPEIRTTLAHELYSELMVAHRPEHRAREMLDFFGSL